MTVTRLLSKSQIYEMVDKLIKLTRQITELKEERKVIYDNLMRGLENIID